MITLSVFASLFKCDISVHLHLHLNVDVFSIVAIRLQSAHVWHVLTSDHTAQPANHRFIFHYLLPTEQEIPK